MLAMLNQQSAEPLVLPIRKEPFLFRANPGVLSAVSANRKIKQRQHKERTVKSVGYHHCVRPLLGNEAHTHAHRCTQMTGVCTVPIHTLASSGIGA